MFDEFLNALEDEEFEEIPVSLDEFVRSPDYLGHLNMRLSDAQYKYVQLASQIYHKETLYKIYDNPTVDWLVENNPFELCLLWGKGAGKNRSTTIALARIIYLLLCLKDPAKYYGKPTGDAIDVLNIAVNAQQAKNAFFNPFKRVIEATPWFRGRFAATRSGEINFDKNITCYSGHSERESWEGYNFIAVVLDEIAAFKTEAETANSNSDRVNSAKAIHDMYRQSVSSRFPHNGKIILISFSRFKGDYIWSRYNEVVADKVVHEKIHKFKLKEDLPDGIDSNEFYIEWEEDEVVGYQEPRVYANKAPSWVVNPQMDIEDRKLDFFRDPVDSLTRYAGMPPDSIDAFFKDRQKVERAFSRVYNPFNEDGSFAESFIPLPETTYYMHVDLAEKKDRAALALSHVSGWQQMYAGTPFETIAPKITVDMVKWWTPKSDQNVEFDVVRDFILSLRHRGFEIAVVSFDRWAGSISLQNELERVGVNVEKQSVQRPEYNDLSILIMEDRLDGYDLPLLIDELVGLKVRPGGKVDHTRQGTNDLADAVCGSVYNTAKYEQYAGDGIVEVEFLEYLEPKKKPNPQNDGVIRPPISEVPRDVIEWIDNLTAI